MTTSEVQADFNQRFHEILTKRTEAQDALDALKATTASAPRLKAKLAQARADMATLRADAKAAGVKLPKVKGANDSDDDGDQAA